MSDESSFEIVNKKAEVETSDNEKSSLLASNWSTNASQSTKLPTFVPVSTSASTGNSMFHPTRFSPAIPESKAANEYPETNQNITNEDMLGVGGLFDWMKDTVGNRGSTLFTKVAEKAKSSMDSVINVLDPQMKDLISGVEGIEVIVTSEKENEVSPIREVFQEIFLRSLVKGLETEELSHAKQVVGFKAAAKVASLKTESVKNLHPTKALIISVQNFIVEVQDEKWYDLDLLTLTDFNKPLCLETYSQMTPVPYSVVNCVKDDTPKDYPHADTGFAASVAQIMASNLQVHPSEWHEALTNVSRKDKILNASKILAALYKNTLIP